MTSIERIIAYGAILAMLVIGVPWYFEHRGAAECKADDKALVTKTEVKNVAAEAVQSAGDKKAETILNASINDPIDAVPNIPPSVQQQACPSSVPPPAGHPSPRPAAAVLRTPETPSVVQPDWHALELGDVQGAHDADAEVIYLHTLLEAQYKLCGGK